MTLRQVKVDFDETWQKISKTVDGVISLKKVPKHDWNERFTYPFYLYFIIVARSSRILTLNFGASLTVCKIEMQYSKIVNIYTVCNSMVISVNTSTQHICFKFNPYIGYVLHTTMQNTRHERF